MRSTSFIPVSVLIVLLVLCSVETLAGPANSPGASSLPLPARHLPPTGQVKSILTLRPLIDIAEGIAIDHRGHIFISNARLENDTRVCEILEIALDGTVTVFATLDPAVIDEFGVGLRGLAFDSKGNLYAALSSLNPDTHGVWRIRRGGKAKRLPGSRKMIQPNSITFDRRGNIYVTDNADGAIWRFPDTGPGKLWIRHALLAPDPNFGIGANGIAFIPPRDLYVANTDLALIAHVRIRRDGNPGRPEVIAAGDELLTIDGLVADARGNLHAVIAAASVFGTSPLVQVDPETGKITASTADKGAFDFPTSLAFGRGPRNHRSVFVVNSGIFPLDRPEAAPGVISVAVGVPGAQTNAIQAAVVEGPGGVGFPPVFDSIQVTEGSVIGVGVWRIGGSEGAVSVNYNTRGSTATGGKDFVATSGTLTWADGDTATKSIVVRILDDDAAEGNEDFEIRLSSPAGGATLSHSSATKRLQIKANDAPGGGGGGSPDGGGGGDGGGGASDFLAVLFLAGLTLQLARR